MIVRRRSGDTTTNRGQRKSQAQHGGVEHTSDAENSPVPELSCDGLLDIPVRFVINGCRCLVQNEDSAVLDQSSRKRDERSLADR